MKEIPGYNFPSKKWLAASVVLWTGISKLIGKMNAVAGYKNGLQKIGWLLFAVCICIPAIAQPYVVTVNTTAAPPINPVMYDYVKSGAVTSMLTNNDTKSRQVFLFGKITRISPSPFTISLSPNYSVKGFTLNPKILVTLSRDQELDAFGNFDLNNLDVSGIDKSLLVYGNGIKLPDGQYNICFYARADIGCSDKCALSDPNLGCGSFMVNCGVVFNTTANQPVNPFVAKWISSGGVNSTVQIQNTGSCNSPVEVKLFGRIECTAPAPFTITLNPSDTAQKSIVLNPGQPIVLNTKQESDAFGDFSPNNLVISGINPEAIMDGKGNIKLPDGSYRVCFYAKYFSSRSGLGENASDPNQGCGNFTVNCSVLFNTTVKPPVNPLVAQWVSSGGINSMVQIQNTGSCNSAVQVKLFGRIECTSPAPFTITMNPLDTAQKSLVLNPGQPIMLNTNQESAAFGDFIPGNLVISGINPEVIMDGKGNIKLPDGNYRICFYAKYFSSNSGLGGNASDPNQGCANFTVNCGIVINTSIVQPVNPVISVMISSGGINSTLKGPDINSCNTSTVQVKLFGKIECTAPSPFTIALKSFDTSQETITISPGTLIPLGSKQQSGAFGNFSASRLDVSGISLAAITDEKGNIKLPDGSYRICYYAKYFSGNSGLGGNASDPNQGCANFTVNCGVIVNTSIIQPVNPVISQMISSGGVSTTVQIQNAGNCNTSVEVKLYGKIECISPAPFTIMVNPSDTAQKSIILNPGQPVMLNTTQQSKALGNFNMRNLVFTGINPSDITDANGNIKLPNGSYRICYYARYFSSNTGLGGNASDPNAGCGNFTVNCGVVINTSIVQAVNPVISQMISSGGINSTVQIQNTGNCNTTVQVKLFGKIERIAPSAFTIMLKPSDTSQQTITISPGTVTQLNSKQESGAFGDLKANKLNISGIDPAAIMDENGNIKLPDGTYRICYYARYFSSNTGLGDNASDPNLGCGSFTVNCGLVINTTVKQPVNPVVTKMISSGGVNTIVQIQNTGNCNTTVQVKLFGKIECLSPSPFTIMVKPGYSPQHVLTINPGAPTQLTPVQQADALGNFSTDNLAVSGINLSAIIDPDGNIKLPDGNYKMCFYARDFSNDTLGENASDPDLGCGNFAITCTNSINVTTSIIPTPPVNPYIARAIAAGNVNTVVNIQNAANCNTSAQIKLFGKIERISPTPFTIMLNPEYTQQPPVTVNIGASVTLSPAQETDAFGGFKAGNLVSSGVDLSSITVNGNIKLPDGNYIISFYGRYFNGDGLQNNASDPNLGGAPFTLCYQAGSAPQFTQPVNSLAINATVTIVQPVSPVVFTWTAPQSPCIKSAGSYKYDLEIWRILDDQKTTDAINNPYVFRKVSLPSNTFLLDTNLFKKVLKEGRRYAIRVRARSKSVDTAIELENNGYSAIESFQYGGNTDTLFVKSNGSVKDVISKPEDYLIPFEERKTDSLDDALKIYLDKGKDTMIPVKQYIAFSLMETGIAYNSSAIELFLALNPELANQKAVKLSYVPRLPVFPAISDIEKQKFDLEHQQNLQSDTAETEKFNQYLADLTTMKQKLPGNAVQPVNDLIGYLNNFKMQLNDFNRVSVNFINEVLSEILFDMHSYAATVTTSQVDKLQSLISTIRELGDASMSGTFLNRLPANNGLLNAGTSLNLFSHTGQLYFEGDAIYTPAAGTKQEYALVIDALLPFNVIVWRNSKELPYRPVTDAPDLTETYRISYILAKLYNHKNPGIASHTSNDLASTIQFSLPPGSVYRFWTRNMLTGKSTEPEDIDLKDVFINSKKRWPNPKKATIVLKVE